jgi:hypothetical protein
LVRDGSKSSGENVSENVTATGTGSRNTRNIFQKYLPAQFRMSSELEVAGGRPRDARLDNRPR